MCIRDRQIEKAENEGTPVSEFLCALLMEEQAYRQNKNLLYRLNGARIPSDFTLKTFPFDRQPGVSKAQIRELSGLAFVERKQNIVFIGNPGTGKSGLATGLLRQALLSGYRGRFYNAQDLLDELYSSLADRSSAKLIKQLCNYDTLDSFTRIRNHSRLNRREVLDALTLAEQVITELMVTTMEAESVTDMLQDQLDRITDSNRRLAGITASVATIGRYGTA